MRVHLEMKATCPDCGLETKDLDRHKKTNCTREGYTPRTRKTRKPRVASTGLFWGNESKVELDVKEEVAEESGAEAGENTIEDAVTSEKEQTSEEPQEVNDEDGGSVISSLDITEDQGEEDIGNMDERVHRDARECEGAEEKENSDDHLGEDDFVMVTPILEDEEYSSNELALELEDDDLFFDANKRTGSLMIPF